MHWIGNLLHYLIRISVASFSQIFVQKVRIRVMQAQIQAKHLGYNSERQRQF